MRSSDALNAERPAIPSLSVVIPALNAARTLPATLTSLGPWADQIVVVDGGSTDGTADVAVRLGARIVAAPRGRGGQIAAGVAASVSVWVLILHADTILAQGWQDVARRHMERGSGMAGYFRFVLDTDDRPARRLERIVAWRCRTLGLPYGDQGLLIERSLLDRIGGVRPLPLMEDVDLVRRIGRSRLVGLAADAVTSAQRWRRDGWVFRSARNLMCLSLYFLGVPPHLIVRVYR